MARIVCERAERHLGIEASIERLTEILEPAAGDRER